MGKFAGFLKHAKNFLFETVPNGIGKSFIKGMGKINKFYKDYKPLIDTGLGIGLGLLGGPIGGSIAGAVAGIGLDRASKVSDKAEWGYNHPGQFWDNYNSGYAGSPSNKGNLSLKDYGNKMLFGKPLNAKNINDDYY